MYNFFRIISIIASIVFLGLCTQIYRKRKEDKSSVTNELRKYVILSLAIALISNTISNQLNSNLMNDIILKHHEIQAEYESFDEKKVNQSLKLISQFKGLNDEDKVKYADAYEYFLRQYYENQNTSEKDIIFHIENYIRDHI